MTKITLTDLVNLQNETTAVNAVNNNNSIIETEFDNTLSRDGSQPNKMTASLDMNSNRILNLPAPSNSLEPVRLEDFNAFIATEPTAVNSIPVGGTTGQYLVKTSGVSFAVGWGGDGSIFYPVCDITGVVDSSSVIQAAINAAQSNGGGIVQLPATGSGSILINSGVTINGGGIHLRGYGYEEFHGYQGQSFPARGTTGTYINTTTLTTPITIGPSANGCIVSDMAFTQAQPADTGGWTPLAYPATILHAGASVFGTSVGSLELTRLLFAGVNIGIQSGSSTGIAGQSQFTGRDFFHNIKGTFYTIGLSLLASSDVCRLQDVHIWPYFSSIIDAGGSTPNIVSYIQANSTGVFLGRSDNPMWDNIFIYGTKYGVHVNGFNPDGGLLGAQITNLNCDSVHNGIFVDAYTASAQYTIALTNFSHNGVNPAIVGDTAIQTFSNTANISIVVVNANMSNYNGPAIFIDGTGNDFTLMNANAQLYNQAVAGTSQLVIVTPGNTGWLYGRIRGVANNSSPGLASAHVTNHADGP